MRTRNYFLGIFLLSGLLWAACGSETTSAEAEEEPSPTEVAFVSLFNGENMEGWRNYNADTISPNWQAEEGAMTLVAGGGGDIVTEKKYENFELTMEWKISENGNSGIFFRVIESDSLGAAYFSGPEMQVLDNAGHPDAKIDKHRAGDNYDLHSCETETVHPAGEWNTVRLIVNEGNVQHWLNGTKVVEYTIGSEEWEALYQASKFSDWPEYARNAKGHIALQDHGDQVWFRNIMIKEL
ncbi:MAG: DUF1080 domain-containing protein [Bacteroidota bacterium]